MLAYIVSTIIAKNLLVELAEENTSSKLGPEVESLTLTEVLIKTSFKDSTSDPSLLLVINLKRRRKVG